MHNEGLQTKGRVALGLIFFSLCYVYVWVVVDPHLIYDGFGTVIPHVPVFATGWPFLRDSLDIPGGLTMYAYGFLSQGYAYSWLGALIVVLVAACLCGLARQHFVVAGHPCPDVLHYVPAIVILLMVNRYEHPLPACLTLSLGLLFSLAFEKVPLRRAEVRLLLFVLLAGTCYALGGAGAAFLFTLMTAAHLLCRREWLSAVLVLPAGAALLRVLADYVFYMSPRQAFLISTPFSREWTAGLKTLSRVLIVLLYAFVPLTVLLIGLWRMAPAKKGDAQRVRPRKADRGKTRVARRSGGASLAYLRRLAQAALPVAALTVILTLSYDKVNRQIVMMNAFSREGRWPEVLDLADRLPKNVYNIYCNHDINRALFYAGRLPYDMLCFPQNPHALLLSHEPEESSMTQVKLSDTFIELGNVDLAEKLASEFLVAKGNLPTVLGSSPGSKS